jgi:hypothetical protein
MQQQEKQEFKFRFVSLHPSKEAFANRPFNEFSSISHFIEKLLEYELANPKKNMTGLIRFKPGIASKYYDGTEAEPYDTRKWWELGYTSCSGQCCFSIPNERMSKWKFPPDNAPEEVKAAKKAEWKEICEEMERSKAENYAKHLAKPNPMPKFKRQSLPPVREWQGFRRIKGPGGLADQIKQIENFSDVHCITFHEIGWFSIDSSSSR